MLIIGCGNRDRGDDAAGLLVVDRLQQMGISAVAFTGDSLGLIEQWNTESEVLLIDAVVTHAPSGSVHVFDVGQASMGQHPATSTHGLGVAEAIGLARQLGRLPRRMRLYCIEGHSFDVGSGVSPLVVEAAETIALQIANEYGTRLETATLSRTRMRRS